MNFHFMQEAKVHLCRRFLEEHDEASITEFWIQQAISNAPQKGTISDCASIKNEFLQAFYEGIMEGMGYKQSRFAFRELAQRIPIDEFMQLRLCRKTRNRFNGRNTYWVLQDYSKTCHKSV